MEPIDPKNKTRNSLAALKDQENMLRGMLALDFALNDPPYKVVNGMTKSQVLDRLSEVVAEQMMLNEATLPEETPIANITRYPSLYVDDIRKSLFSSAKAAAPPLSSEQTGPTGWKGPGGPSPRIVDDQTVYFHESITSLKHNGINPQTYHPRDNRWRPLGYKSHIVSRFYMYVFRYVQQKGIADRMMWFNRKGDNLCGLYRPLEGTIIRRDQSLEDRYEAVVQMWLSHCNEHKYVKLLELYLENKSILCINTHDREAVTITYPDHSTRKISLDD